MKWVALVLLLLVCSTGVVAEDDDFFAKLVKFFQKDVSKAVDEICDPCTRTVCTYGNTTFICPLTFDGCTAVYENCKKLTCSEELKKLQKKTFMERIFGSKVTCNPCTAVICDESICPSSLATCSKNAQNCVALTCDLPEDIPDGSGGCAAMENTCYGPGGPESRYDTYEKCGSYFGRCECGVTDFSKCEKYHNLCYDGSKPVLCASNLEWCEQKHGWCMCGTWTNHDYPDTCTAAKNTCYDTTGAHTCTGTYEQCSKKYTMCECGVVNFTACSGPNCKTPSTNPGTTKTPPACTATVHSCQNPSIFRGQGDIYCTGSFASCQAQYDKCHCGICESKVNYCNDDDGLPVTCKDTIVNCERKYGRCLCGEVPETCTAAVQTCPNPSIIRGQAQIYCRDTLPRCNAQYDGKCHCGVCDSKENYCTDEEGLPVVCKDTIINCEKKYGRCICGAGEEACKESVQTCKNPSILRGQPPVYCRDTLSRCNAQYDDQCYCGTCDSMVNLCTDDEGLPVVCKDNIINCEQRYGRCLCGGREDSCKEQVQTCRDTKALVRGGDPAYCRDTLPRCNAQYDDSCRCGICNSKQNFCFDGNGKTVVCNDNIINCDAKFEGICFCGPPKPTDLPPNRRTPYGDDSEYGSGSPGSGTRTNTTNTTKPNINISSGACAKTSHTCVVNGQKITCTGTIDNCNSLHGNTCTCGTDTRILPGSGAIAR